MKQAQIAMVDEDTYYNEMVRYQARASLSESAVNNHSVPQLVRYLSREQKLHREFSPGDTKGKIVPISNPDVLELFRKECRRHAAQMEARVTN